MIKKINKELLRVKLVVVILYLKKDMKMKAKLRAYLRYNPIDLRGTDQYVVYSFVLTILAVIFGIAWCNDFLCFLRLPLKTVLPYSSIPQNGSSSSAVLRDES